ncbi:hypothetical protein [Citromicrobium sp. JL477]|nr:hypothetical protein [Citromicrobium sp. JL477]ALG60879.1 hypothetical protein WG74_08565 [Citromicrobium sp. JL477]
MPKAKAHPDQVAFTFEPPVLDERPAVLAGLEQEIAGVVGTILASTPMSREEMAARMTELLGEPISRAMLDAYASPARTEHKVPMSRFFALVLATKRHDLFDPLVRKIGAGLLVGDEIKTARLGQLDRIIQNAREEKRKLAQTAPLIRSGAADV